MDVRTVDAQAADYMDCKLVGQELQAWLQDALQEVLKHGAEAREQFRAVVAEATLQPSSARFSQLTKVCELCRCVNDLRTEGRKLASTTYPLLLQSNPNVPL